MFYFQNASLIQAAEIVLFRTLFSAGTSSSSSPSKVNTEQNNSENQFVHYTDCILEQLIESL